MALLEEEELDDVLKADEDVAEAEEVDVEEGREDEDAPEAADSGGRGLWRGRVVSERGLVELKTGTPCIMVW